MNRRHAAIVIAALFVVVAVPLAISTVRIVRDTSEQSDVRNVTTAWASGTGWELVAVVGDDDKTIARLEGTLPAPDTATLRAALAARGIDVGHIRIELLPRQTVDFDD